MKRAFVFTTLLLWGCGAQDEQTPPRQISPSTFHYPEELWDAGEQGETLLRVRVTAEGQVDTAAVERSSGQAAFDSAALAGAFDLHFEPARRGDRPVEAWVLLPVQFNLDRTPPADTLAETPEEP